MVVHHAVIACGQCVGQRLLAGCPVAAGLRGQPVHGVAHLLELQSAVTCHMCSSLQHTGMV